MPISMSLAQLGADPNSADDPAINGMKLAQAEQQMLNQKQEVIKQKEDLELAKFNRLNSTMQTLARTNPAVAKKMVPGVADSFRRSGIAVDPGVLDLMASDEGYKQRMLALSQDADALASDPAARQQYIQAHGDVGQFDKGLMTLESYSKQAKDLAIANARNETMERSAQIRADGVVGAAQVRGATTQANTALRANQQYQNTMKTVEQGLMQANRAVHLVQGIDAKELKINKTLRADLTNVMASLVGGGKPSTVYGQQHMEFDSAYQSVSDKLNYLRGRADDTLPPEQFEQLKVDINALKGLYDLQHKDTYSSFREGVPEQFRGDLDKRYGSLRKNLKLNAELSAPGAAAESHTPPPPGRTPAPDGLTDNQRTYLSKARGLKKADGSAYTEAEIMAKMPKQ